MEQMPKCRRGTGPPQLKEKLNSFVVGFGVPIWRVLVGS